MASDREHSGELPSVPQDAYTPEALAACEKALRTIISRIGTWGPRLILFGGLARRYLVKCPPPELKEHTGTTDLDVVIGVEIDIADAGVYTKLQEELKKSGFSPSKRGSFAWERRVDGVFRPKWEGRFGRSGRAVSEEVGRAFRGCGTAIPAHVARP